MLGRPNSNKIKRLRRRGRNFWNYNNSSRILSRRCRGISYEINLVKQMRIKMNMKRSLIRW